MSASEILERIRRLPEKDRLAVTEQILEEFGYFDNDPTSEQIEEMERRAEGLRRNPASAVPWDQVRAELKQRLKRRACAAK